jgi:hypothetical protein
MIVAACAGLGLSACQQATNGGSGGSISGPVQGKINGQSFTAVQAVATASTTVANGYDIELTGSAATPSITFSVGSQPKSYTVTSFGLNGGLAVYAYIGGESFVGFDSGTVVIAKIDTAAEQITGQFNALATTDNLSSLSGNFTATIQ